MNTANKTLKDNDYFTKWLVTLVILFAMTFFHIYLFNETVQSSSGLYKILLPILPTFIYCAAPCILAFLANNVLMKADWNGFFILSKRFLMGFLWFIIFSGLFNIFSSYVM
jgi:hypothetical protein